MSIDLNFPRSPRDTNEAHISNIYIQRVTECPFGSERALLVAELHLRSRFLRDGDAVVCVQRARSLVLSIRGNHDLEVRVPQLCRGHCPDCPQREHSAPANVHRYRGKVYVVEQHGLAFSVEGFVGQEVVEDILREVRSDGSGVFVCDRGDQDGITKEELKIDREC